MAKLYRDAGLMHSEQKIKPNIEMGDFLTLNTTISTESTESIKN